MRLWSSEILEIELAREQLSEREKVKYLLLPILLGACLGGPITWLAPRYGLRPPRFDVLVALLNSLLMVAVTIYGIRKAYRANRRIDGRNFIERYAILVLPVSFRFAALLVPLLVAAHVALRFLDSRIAGGMANLYPFYRLVFPLAMLGFYQMLARSFSRFGGHLRRAAAPKP